MPPSWSCVPRGSSSSLCLGLPLLIPAQAAWLLVRRAPHVQRISRRRETISSFSDRCGNIQWNPPDGTAIQQVFSTEVGLVLQGLNVQEGRHGGLGKRSFIFHCQVTVFTVMKEKQIWSARVTVCCVSWGLCFRISCRYKMMEHKEWYSWGTAKATAKLPLFWRAGSWAESFWTAGRAPLRFLALLAGDLSWGLSTAKRARAKRRALMLKPLEAGFVEEHRFQPNLSCLPSSQEGQRRETRVATNAKGFSVVPVPKCLFHVKWNGV